jgi:uncharacterized protein (DUF427 family)
MSPNRGARHRLFDRIIFRKQVLSLVVGGPATHHRVRKQAKYPAVHYIPRQDVRMQLLQPSKHETFCPYKGDCSYFSIPVGGEKSTNAVWTYEHPNEAVNAISGYLAFYPDRVDSIEVS